MGVLGQGGAGNANGVQGQGTGNFSGVAGFADPNSTTGPGTGVWGQGASGGPGVRGIADGGPNTGGEYCVGVYGQGGPGNAGVYGQGGDGNANGVEGHGSGEFAGVAGFADPNSATGPSTGVFGSGASGGPGVRGIGDVGVVGISAAASGVSVMGQASAANSIAISGVASGPQTTAGSFTGPVQITGDLTVTGSLTAGNKHAAVPFPDGSHRRLYCMESPESWFEDFGTGVMVDGQAQVRLDPDFATTVDTGDYHVFLTEYDDNNGLYVTDRSATGFVVRAKASDNASGTFSYRVVARRRDIEAPRLETVTMPSIKFEPDTLSGVRR